MAKNHKKPDIRFSGYADNWEQRKLGETFEYLQNNTLSRDSLNYKNPNVKNIHYGDILVKFDEILDGSSKDIPYINSEFDLSKFSKSLLRDGDIIFSDTAEDDTVGKAIELQNVNAPFILSGLHTIPCRPLIPFGKGYLGNFLNSNSYRMQLRPLVQGIKVSSISKSALKDTMIEYPKSLDEQERIGSLFQNITKMITLHQRKLEKLKLIKKALLQKLFPKNGSKFPELRFKGLTDAWEQCKVNDLFKITRGQVLATSLTTPEKTSENIYPVYSSQTKNNGLMGYYSEYLFEDAITWTTDGANAGTVNFRPGRFYSTNVNGVLINENGYSCYAVSEIINKVAYKYVSKVGNPKLMNNVMAEIDIIITADIDELGRISALIEAYNQYITLHQHKLEMLKNVKKGLLQKMFI